MVLFSTATPSEPRNVVVEHIDKSGVMLSWDTPRSDGGSRIQGYIIEKRTPFTPRWTRINKQVRRLHLCLKPWFFLHPIVPPLL